MPIDDEPRFEIVDEAEPALIPIPTPSPAPSGGGE